MKEHTPGTTPKAAFWQMFVSLTFTFPEMMRADQDLKKQMAAVWFDRMSPKFSPWVLAKSFDRATRLDRFPSLGVLVSIAEDLARQEKAVLARKEAESRPRLPPQTKSLSDAPREKSELEKIADEIDAGRLSGEAARGAIFRASKKAGGPVGDLLAKFTSGPPPREGDFCGRCGQLWEGGEVFSDCRHAGHTNPVARIGVSQ